MGSDDVQGSSFSSARPFSTLDASSPKPARSDPVLGSSFRRRKTRCLSPITSPPSLPTPPQSPTSCLSPRPSPPNLSPRRDSTGTRPGSTRSSPTSSRPSLQPRPPASPRPTCLGSACGCRLCRCVDSFPSRPLSPLSKRRISELFCVLCIYSPVARTYSLFTVSCVCLTSASNVRLAVDHDRKPSPADRGGGKASRQGAQRAHGDRADEDVRRRPWGGLVGTAEEWGKESEGEGRWNGRGRPVQRLGGDDPGRRRVAGSCAS